MGLSKLGLKYASRFFAISSASDYRLATSLGGVRVANPVGLAPGFDKDCDLMSATQRLGFGYVVVGSILCDPRQGNPKPRLARDIQNESILVNLGLPSKGVDHSVMKLRRGAAKRQVPLIASIAGFFPEEFLKLHQSLEPLVDGIELSVQCPNIEYDSSFIESFESVAKTLGARKSKPLFIKLPPYSTPKEKALTVDLLEFCTKNRIEGVSVMGVKRIPAPGIAGGMATMSGRKIYSNTLQVVSEIYSQSGGKLAIMAAGGIFSGADAYEVIKRGATTVEMYSGLVFEGPGAVRRMNGHLLASLEKDGYKSIEEARGVVTEHKHLGQSQFTPKVLA